ncbi:uncharacterized protein SCHCODRAFT_02620893 [Schizophyllum commune H4-8]|uniref:Uncharacterized protein n=1 Tax=Schizophyllum commune (strain H4-8 / FGSC 9210) TaxID=578458 RepID=D8PN08_SCHCM|nr:uncharacterized protein SCHCODRAFT_02620893 [Schizophyllum commune H4-8]KAI5893109.1 hypothetical protein SCHCODRAFT_02620893 [Schizophyllum commune H4-8]
MPKVTTKSTRVPAAKAERRGKPKTKREAARVKVEHPSTAIAVVADSSSSKRATTTAGPSTKPPRVIARTFIDDNIVLLHCECNYNSETISLHNRDGLPLPRPNVVGFELIDRLIRSPVGWTGFGTPYVYQASVMKRGSYMLKYKGREVWSYGQDDLAKMERENEEANETPYDMDKWNRLMAFYAEKVKVIRELDEDRVLARFGNNTIAYDDPNEEFYPEEFFVRMDSELTHEWREYKRRTGKAMQYGPMPVVKS